MLMICVMSSPVTFSTFFIGKLEKGCMLRKFILKNMHLLSFMSSFKCFKIFPLKISESNFLEVYAVVHYIEASLYLC